MKFYSTKDKSHRVSFRQAVVKGLPPDRGLYFPEHIPQLDQAFFGQLGQMESAEIGTRVMEQYVAPDIPRSDLYALLIEVLDFEIPLVRVSEDCYALELFHGPTMAFKDVGARFMSRCLSRFSKDGERVVVLVATSGDTGSAVAQGFFGVDGVEVTVLYPKGKVSPLQEKQFATLGGNIEALEVDGNFDDCQKLVKDAFLDATLNQHLRLSSANSINVARWLPQSIYYFLAAKQLRQNGKLVVSVPSGNFGNLTAGMLARRMGLPIDHFIAATNVNDVVPEYLETETYRPRPSIQTIANAMDVGDPSNFSRMLELYGGSYPKIIESVSGYAFTDSEISQAIRTIKNKHGYLLDPHGATGYLALKALNQPGTKQVFLGTAHPAKFLETVEETLGEAVAIPEQLRKFAEREVRAIPMENDYSYFQKWLLTRYGS